MALGQDSNLLSPSVTAGEDLLRGIFVKLNTTGQAVKCGAGERPIGVTDAAAKSGKTVPIITGGTALVVGQGGTNDININDDVKSDANGKAVTAGTQTNSKFVSGVALTKATEDGDTIRILLQVRSGAGTD